MGYLKILRCYKQLKHGLCKPITSPAIHSIQSSSCSLSHWGLENTHLSCIWSWLRHSWESMPLTFGGREVERGLKREGGSVFFKTISIQDSTLSNKLLNPTALSCQLSLLLSLPVCWDISISWASFSTTLFCICHLYHSSASFICFPQRKDSLKGNRRQEGVERWKLTAL